MAKKTKANKAEVAKFVTETEAIVQSALDMVSAISRRDPKQIMLGEHLDLIDTLICDQRLAKAIIRRASKACK